MIRKIGSFLFILAFSFVLLVAVPHSAHGIVAGNSCNHSFTEGAWNNTHEYAYLTNKDITVAPTWCIIDPADNQRLVFQANGDLVVWSGLHSGGQVLWQSFSGNQGATQLRFQADGNVVIYRGTYALWAADWKIGQWPSCHVSSFSLTFDPHALMIYDISYCSGNRFFSYVEAW